MPTIINSDNILFGMTTASIVIKMDITVIDIITMIKFIIKVEILTSGEKFLINEKIIIDAVSITNKLSASTIPTIICVL